MRSSTPTPALPAACATPTRAPNSPSSCSGPLLLAGMVISALTAIFLVSCVDLWDAWAGSHSAGGGGGGGPNGLWEGLTGLANSSSSLSTPASVLPQALGLPLAHLGGTA